jgi:S-formylglutathione hydrolase FrmB
VVPARTLFTIALAILGSVLGFAPAAAAAPQLIEIDLPSRAGNIDASQIRFNGDGHPKTLKANVLLPEGYDPRRRWPVLYLLHGAGESYRSWVSKTKADAVIGPAKLPAIVVMPDAATGFYTNWWNGGRRGSPGWERYFLDEVIPAVEARFPIRPERRWHAVAGFSMGGFGSAYLASQRPDYFGSAGPMSGFLAPRRPEMPLAFDQATGQSYQAIYGPADGAYVAGHDPVALAGNLRHTRMFLITGDGIPDPAVEPPSNPQSVVTGSIGETDLRFHSEDLAVALRAAGADVTLTVLRGIHDHPYWTDHLRRLLVWDPFKPVVERPREWTYQTVADRGRAWDVTYRFAAHPEVVQTLRATGAGYSAAGAGTVELCAADGSGLVAELPFETRRLGRAVRLSVLGWRGRSILVRLRAEEPVVARLSARVARRGRSRPLRATSVELRGGEQRTVALTIPRAARRLMRRGAVRVRAVARHGSCEGGRWSTAARTLRR